MSELHTNTDTDADKYILNGAEVTPNEVIETITVFLKKQQFRVDILTARIAELEAERRWVPVGEKPLEAGTFFVLLKNGEVTKDFTFIDGGRYYWWWNRGANITHYMPLPKLPEVQK